MTSAPWSPALLGEEELVAEALRRVEARKGGPDARPTDEAAFTYLNAALAYLKIGARPPLPGGTRLVVTYERPP